MLYFPNGLALSPSAEGEPARYLYVTNSDFDLRYNAGTVQAYSLDELADAVADCEDDPCQLDPGVAFVTEVPIPPFSTGITSSRDGERLLITTRTGDALTYVRADPTATGDGVLPCSRDRADCAEQAEPGPDRNHGGKLTWPEEPVAVLAGELSDWSPETFAEDEDEYALVAHRTGELSVFVEHDGALVMTDVSARMVGGATDLAYDAVSGLAYASLPNFIARLGLTIPERDGNADPLGATVFDAGNLLLRPGPYSEIRGMSFLPAIDGAGAALARPNALITARFPSSLVLADVASAGEAPPDSSGAEVARVRGATALGSGAARLAVGIVDGIPLAVVACFDSRELALVDLRTMLTRSVVPNLSGPYAVVLDGERKLVYAADFRSSVIRILDIAAALEPGGSAPIDVVATLGKPRVLQELR
jgi:hypothetical protein